MELCVGSLVDEYRTHAFSKVGLPADIFTEWNFEREFVADVGLGAGGGQEFGVVEVVAERQGLG